MEQNGVTHRRTILLVDDEALVRMSSMAMLEDAGFDVVEASNGADALAILAERDDIATLITDHRMPNMTGSELIEAARQLHPALRVILMTGLGSHSGQLTHSTVLQLSKPFQFFELSQAVEATLLSAD